MNLKELKLHHFRNYEDEYFSFEENAVHILHGNNAQGKTNIIEAIYFLSHLRSFRVSSIEPLKMEGFDDFSIDAQIESLERRQKLRISVIAKKKSLFHHGKPVKAYSAFAGLCNAVLFSPDDMNLFTASPAARRRFIDMELFKLSTAYACELSQYQKLLKLKNAALKQIPQDPGLIGVYTDSMIACQKILIPARDKFVKELTEKTRQLYPFFTETKEELDIQYKTYVKDLTRLDEELVRTHQAAADKEMLLKTTALGIHKDDIVFLLNGVPVSQHASQGQKRSFLLAVKLALCQIIFEKSGQYPILLLDDVFSELDETRRKQLMLKLPEPMQIFITTTEKIDMTSLNRPVIHYAIKNGNLLKGEGINE